MAALWLAACGVAYALAVWNAPWLIQPANITQTHLVEFIRFNPLLRLPEFLVGIILCKLYLAERARNHSSFCARHGSFLYLAGLAFTAAVVICHDRIPSGFLVDELFMPASVAVILGLCFSRDPISRWLSTRHMLFLGQASYAVYLLHVALFSYFAAAAKRFHHTDAQQLLLDLFYLVSLLALSFVVFVKLEEPARRAIIKRLRRGTPRQPIAVSVQPVSADPF
jgi:peptidoglycan/LPS O-acetylase OafA/YrhL